MAEIDLAAKRHATSGRTGQAVGERGERDGVDLEDMTEQAEKQVGPNGAGRGGRIVMSVPRCPLSIP